MVVTDAGCSAVGPRFESRRRHGSIRRPSDIVVTVADCCAVGPRFESRRRHGSTRGLLATDHVILNHGQVTWTTPELALPSPNYHTTPTGGRFRSRIAAQHGGCLVVLGLNSRQGQPRSDTYTTQLPRPLAEGG
ncbi:hypothetical protein TNCV_883981 [Trichonephila clavipes]|nr:hypothetical protein TNCV_883981 [Trichonephila clavipes]